jgi:hypothetical protein
MKKLMLFAILAVVGFATFAGVPKFSYVLTSKGIVYAAKLNMGMYNTRIVTSDGERRSINNDDGYCKNGNVYMKMPEMQDNKPTGKTVWMELLAVRNGFSIYKYDSFLPSGQAVTDFYVFEGERYVLQLDEKNTANVLSFFGLK